MKKYKDLTGKRFGYLTVLRYKPDRENKNVKRIVMYAAIAVPRKQFALIIY